MGYTKVPILSRPEVPDTEIIMPLDLANIVNFDKANEE